MAPTKGIVDSIVLYLTSGPLSLILCCLVLVLLGFAGAASVEF